MSTPKLAPPYNLSQNHHTGVKKCPLFCRSKSQRNNALAGDVLNFV